MPLTIRPDDGCADVSEIESLLKNENAHLLEKVAGASFYQIREDVVACAGGVGKVNAAMSAQLLISRYQPDVVLCVRDYQSLLLREFNGDFFS